MPSKDISRLFDIVSKAFDRVEKLREEPEGVISFCQERKRVATQHKDSQEIRDVVAEVQKLEEENDIISRVKGKSTSNSQRKDLQ